ncbi:MAG TPA: sugar transferase [Syntrophales bacterium]|nr:sugar transferase [Syntrophales bacterium]
MERRRSERSGKPFLLMTMEIAHLAQKSKGKLTLKKIVAEINSLTRETDIKGWYADGSVIGIIFTEVSDNSKDMVTESIISRVKANLFSIIQPEMMREINISLIWFPDKDDKFNNNYTPNELFYPDRVENNRQRKFALFVKRVMDITGSLVGLALFSPLFIIIPILIKVSSKGPVFYKQQRTGLFGKEFTFLKFRSMWDGCKETDHKNYIKNLISSRTDQNVENGEIDKNHLFKMNHDDRITPIGQYLRKTSLDELPQFINVLKGDMSLVGPRPPIPYEREEYEIWHMKRIIGMKPGITGLWQVEGRSMCSFDDMVRLDLKYIEEWSIWMDIKIMLKTPWAVISGKGAY